MFTIVTFLFFNFRLDGATTDTNVVAFRFINQAAESEPELDPELDLDPETKTLSKAKKDANKSVLPSILQFFRFRVNLF
jgi:hypothetical protein